MTGPRILLVDDEVSSAEVLGMILAQEGYHVTLAADGRQAMARLDEATPDLLITDFMMPVMNGSELVRALRAIPRYSGIPVILMSGAPESALRAYAVEHDTFLRKPFNLEEFLAAVDKLMRADGAEERPAC